MQDYDEAQQKSYAELGGARINNLQCAADVE